MMHHEMLLRKGRGASDKSKKEAKAKPDAGGQRESITTGALAGVGDTEWRHATLHRDTTPRSSSNDLHKPNPREQGEIKNAQADGMSLRN